MNRDAIFSRPGIILNACCLMNLYASGCMHQILQSLPVSVSVAEYVYRYEELSVYRREDTSGNSLTEQVDIHALVEDNLIRIVLPSTAEDLSVMVSYAALFATDGEAYTAALAQQYMWMVGVDDLATVKFFRTYAKRIPLLSTPVFVKYWAEHMLPSSEEIGQAIRGIEQRALYVPPVSHPLYQWWKAYSNGEG